MSTNTSTPSRYNWPAPRVTSAACAGKTRFETRWRFSGPMGFTRLSKRHFSHAVVTWFPNLPDPVGSVVSMHERVGLAKHSAAAVRAKDRRFQVGAMQVAVVEIDGQVVADVG